MEFWEILFALIHSFHDKIRYKSYVSIDIWQLSLGKKYMMWLYSTFFNNKIELSVSRMWLKKYNFVEINDFWHNSLLDFPQHFVKMNTNIVFYYFTLSFTFWKVAAFHCKCRHHSKTDIYRHFKEFMCKWKSRPWFLIMSLQIRYWYWI